MGVPIQLSRTTPASLTRLTWGGRTFFLRHLSSLKSSASLTAYAPIVEAKARCSLRLPRDVVVPPPALLCSPPPWKLGQMMLQKGPHRIR